MLAQKLTLSYSSKIFIQFIQIAVSILVARIAGPTVFGTLAFGLAYVSMFHFISGLGLGSAHIKLISEGRDVSKCISTYSVLKLFTTSLYVLVTLSFFLYQKFILNVQFESEVHQRVIFIFLIMNTITSLLNIPNMTFAGKTEQAKQDIPLIFKNIIHQIFRVIVVLLGYRTLALAFSNFIALILIIPLVLYLFKDYHYGKFEKSLVKEYIKIAIPLIAIGISDSLFRSMDKVMLQFFYNSEEVGFYTAGYRIGGFVLMIATSVGILFFPIFSKRYAEGNISYINKKIFQFEKFCYLFIMPVTIFLALYSDSIVIFLLGNKYISSIQILSVLTIAMFFLVLNQPYGNLFIGMGYFRISAVVTLLRLGLFILILYLFICPSMLNLGAKGAAYSIFVINFTRLITSKVLVKWKEKSINIFKNSKFVLFGIINFIIFYYLYTYLESKYGLLFRVIFPIIYFCLTYFSFYILKWINKDDWKMLLTIMDVKAMKKYIVSEIKPNRKNNEQ